MTKRFEGNGSIVIVLNAIQIPKPNNGTEK